jgi:hypothetical protein
LYGSEVRALTAIFTPYKLKGLHLGGLMIHFLFICEIRSCIADEKINKTESCKNITADARLI